MSLAARAYGKVSQASLGGRELESAVLLRAAFRLQAVRDDWAGRQHELDEALTNNRKLWTVLSTAATGPESTLPREVRQNIANLAVFIFGHTLKVMAAPAPERLDVLVSINRNIAAGLRGSAEDAAREDAPREDAPAP
jgi:flagellar biosynthesis activator protein FlaF